jgi:hypothetical protein
MKMIKDFITRGVTVCIGALAYPCISFSFHLSDVDECEEINWSGKRIVFTFFPWDLLSLGAPFVLLVEAAVVAD